VAVNITRAEAKFLPFLPPPVVRARARIPKEALDRAAVRGNEMLRRFESTHRATR